MLWLLVKLRYRVVLAAVRGSAAGNMALVLALLSGLLIAALLVAAGFSTAALSAYFGTPLTMVRWLLLGLFVNALVLTLSTGRRLHGVFSALLVRPYPIARVRLYFVRQLIGLFDPLWLLFLTTAAGLVAGCAWRGSGHVLAAACGALLFVCFSYLSAGIALLILDRLLRNGSAKILICGLGLAGFTAVPLVSISIPPFWQRALFARADRLLELLPPGLAASAIVGPGWSGFALLQLLAWTLFAGTLMFWLEQPSITYQAERCASLWPWLARQSAAVFGRQAGPLVAKSLLYQLRCLRVRLNFVLTIAMTALLPSWMGRSGGADAVYAVQLALLFLSSAMATNVVLLNQFGFDGPDGFDRYMLLPVALGRALKASSFASLIVGGAVVCASATACVAVTRTGFGMGSVWTFLPTGLAGLFFFNALGLWTSVLAPRRAQFDGIAGSQLSWQGNLIQGGSIALALGLAFVTSALPVWDSLTRAWWLPSLVAGLMLALYGFSLASTSQMITVVRHELRCGMRIWA